MDDESLNINNVGNMSGMNWEIVLCVVGVLYRDFLEQSVMCHTLA